MKRYDVSAGELYVRLVVDEGPSNPSSSEVVSLLKAMETARDLDVDLIGINLEQDPPVVKAQEYTKLAYRTLSKKQKSSSKATKEFTLRAGIAKNDLDRKVMNVIDYLKKGHNCQLSISSSGFNMRTNPGGIMVMIQTLTDQVGDVGVCEKGVQINEDGNRANFLLRPNRKRSES
jgi:translation initiation factor IF-3